MTVAVRALATRELTRANARRIIARELLVGIINGAAFGLITAMVAIDNAGSMDQTVLVPKAATQITPSVMGLSPGERVTVRELLDGLFLDSGNDAAEAFYRRLGYLPMSTVLALDLN